jgi:WD40-like Beta Propeller Repeat
MPRQAVPNQSRGANEGNALRSGRRKRRCPRVFGTALFDVLEDAADGRVDVGKTERLLVKPGHYQWPRVSPDSQRLALKQGTDTVVYDPRRDTLTRLEASATALGPIWSPDGRYILYQGLGIRYVRSDGAANPNRCFPRPSQQTRPLLRRTNAAGLPARTLT